MLKYRPWSLYKSHSLKYKDRPPLAFHQMHFPNATYNNTSVDASWKTVANQAGDELSCRGAIVSANPGRQSSHRGIIQVERTAVGRVGIQCV